MPTRNISRDPRDYSASCTPDRFEDENVVFRCTVTIGSATSAPMDAVRDTLTMDVALSVDDTDSIGEMRRMALQIYGAALQNAAKAVSDALSTGDHHSRPDVTAV